MNDTLLSSSPKKKPVLEGRQARQRKLIMILLEDVMTVVLTALIYLYFPNGHAILVPGLLVLTLNTARLWFEKQLRNAFNVMIRWRWLIAAIVFILLVLFRLHASSAASFAALFSADPSVQESVVFGFPHPFRTDEYSVQLSYYFSQFYNNYNEVSHQMSVTGQDMILGYNAPVLNLTLLAKPLVWGYVLFGNEIGMSWYFSAEYVLMFMAGLEMFLILTRSRPVSVFGAFFLTWAPGMQWWLCPHFYDPIMWSVWLFVCGYYFFRWQGWKKWAMTIVSALMLVNFSLAIFPSLQVPCGLVMLALLCATLYRDRAKITYRWQDLWNVAAVLVIVAVILVPVLWSMREELKLLMGTEYPGQRAVNGGTGEPWMLFLNPTAFFQPFFDPPILNNSEISAYNHFGIALILVYPYLRYCMTKSKNPQRFIGDVFFVALVVEVFYLMVPIPMWLAKITLLSMANRMQTVYGFTATMATVWMARMIYKTEMPYKKTVGLVVTVVYGVLALSVAHYMIFPVHTNYLPTVILYALPVGLAFTFFLNFTKWRELFFAAMTGWTVVTGVMVNPISSGAAAVEDYPIVRAAQQIEEQDPDAWWLGLNQTQAANLLLANGMKVLNATNFYPDLDKWRILFPDLDNNPDLYATVNRYANINVRLRGDDQDTAISVPWPDLLMVELAPRDLATWQVGYMAGNQADEQILSSAGISYEVVFADDATGDRIFKLNH